MLGTPGEAGETHSSFCRTAQQDMIRHGKPLGNVQHPLGLHGKGRGTHGNACNLHPQTARECLRPARTATYAQERPVRTRGNTLMLPATQRHDWPP